MTNDTARAILDDLFKDGDEPIVRFDTDASRYCAWCSVDENDQEVIEHLDTCPYARYRKMVEGE